MKIVFIGPQGCGKGTQAKRMSRRLGILHISTGDLLRGAEGDLRRELDEYMNSGKLVPDELIVKILKERINQDDCKNGFILDGFPRNLNQAELLKEIVDIDKIVEIGLSDEEAVKRISGRVNCTGCGESYNTLTDAHPKVEGKCDGCGGELVRRADDSEEAVKKRLEIYHSETEPVLDLYKDEVVRINGEQSIDVIAKEIEEKVG